MDKTEDLLLTSMKNIGKLTDNLLVLSHMIISVEYLKESEKEAENSNDENFNSCLSRLKATEANLIKLENSNPKESRLVLLDFEEITDFKKFSLILKITSIVSHETYTKCIETFFPNTTVHPKTKEFFDSSARKNLLNLSESFRYLRVLAPLLKEIEINN